MNTRVIANQILCHVSIDRLSLNDALHQKLSDHISTQDQAFIKECCFGVLRWYGQLSAIANLLLNTPLKNKDADIHNLLLLGLYQIEYTQVPDHAAVSETVAVCHLIKKNWAAGLINKCLRRYLQERTTILSKIEHNESVFYSHPQWLIDKIKLAYPEAWQQILTANNNKPPLWLRVNIQKTSPQEYLKILNDHHIDAQQNPHLPNCILLPNPLPVEKIPHFFDGYISIQDLAGQFAAHLLDLKKGQRVLDACAAPGSKTSHILELQPQLTKLVILDKDPTRFSMIKDNIMRLSLNHQSAQLVLADVSHTTQWWDGTLFDRILLDAPCSATGVIRRHPDIKLLRQLQDLDHLAQVQMQMLIALWKLLKKNGKLLYSTCSVLAEENEQLVANFVAHHDDAKIEKLSLPIGELRRFGTQILPHPDGPDGFYYALLIKK